MSGFDTFLYYFSIFAYLGCNLVYYHGIAACIYGITGRQARGWGFWGHVVLLLALNVSLFLGYSMAGLGLVENWLLFTGMIYGESRLFFQTSRREAIFLSVEACLITLAAMLLFRSALAIAMNVPLYTFGTNLLGQSYWLVVPLIFAYAFTGVAFWLYFSKRNLRPLCHLIASGAQSQFFLITAGILLSYLLIQASFYAKIGNSLTEKLWALFTCLFVLFGHWYAFQYAIRTSYLYSLDGENVEMLRQLNLHKSEESHLEQLLEVDELTGVRNRGAGEQALARWQEEEKHFTLCVVDLDGLKYVNDHLGHLRGDEYITAVAEVLCHNCRADEDLVFRYGGDEFVLAIQGAPTLEVERRMEQVSRAVVARGRELSMPMRISFGCSWAGTGESFSTVFERADTAMYQMKRENKRRRQALEEEVHSDPPLGKTQEADP